MIAATACLCLSSALGSFLPPFSHGKAAAWNNRPAEKAIVPVPVLCYLLNGIYPHLSNFRPSRRPPGGWCPAQPGSGLYSPPPGGPPASVQAPASRMARRIPDRSTHGRACAEGARGRGAQRGETGQKPERSAAHWWELSGREMLNAKKHVLLPAEQSNFSVQGTTFQVPLNIYERTQRRERMTMNTDGQASPSI